ncbi:unnamed protein product, partial [Allacma fusca]
MSLDLLDRLDIYPGCETDDNPRIGDLSLMMQFLGCHGVQENFTSVIRDFEYHQRGHDHISIKPLCRTPLRTSNYELEDIPTGFGSPSMGPLTGPSEVPVNL